VDNGKYFVTVHKQSRFLHTALPGATKTDHFKVKLDA